MKSSEIIRLAQEAGKYADYEYGRACDCDESCSWNFIRDERFAELVAAAERERIAKWYGIVGWMIDEDDVADAIRANKD